MPPKKKKSRVAQKKKSRKQQQKKEKQKRRKVAEQDKGRISTISNVVRKLGYRGEKTFKPDGTLDKSYKSWLVRNYKKGKSPNFDDKSIKVAKNINKLIPRGYTFNPTTNNIILETSTKTKKGKIFEKFDKAGLKLENNKLVPKVEDRRNVSGTVKFRLTVRRKNKLYSYPREELFDIQYTPNWKENLKQQIIARYIDSPDTQIEFEEITGSRFRFNQQEGKVMADIRMQRIGLKLDGDDPHHWDSQQGKCTVDFLRYYYKDDIEKGDLKKDYFSDEAFDEVFNEGWREEGVSARELLDGWCNAMNIRGLALNKNKEIIRVWKPEKRAHRKTLVFIVHNKHIHPITNTDEIKALNKTLSGTVDGVKVNNKKWREQMNEKREEQRENLEMVYIKPTKDEREWQFMMKKMLEEKTETLNENIELKDAEGRLYSFILNNKKYIFQDEINGPVFDWYDERGLKWDGLNATQIVKDCMENLEIDTSTPNALTNQILLTEGVKDRVHLGGILPYDSNGEIETAELRSFDICKCHTSILKEPIENWILLKRHNHFLPFKGGNIKLGLYYVEPPEKNKYLFFVGKKLYSSGAVNYALSKKYITKKDIKYYIHSSSSKSKTYFKRLFEKYLDITGNETEVEKAFNKLLNNMTSGMLGKTEVKLLTKNISLDVNECWNHLLENTDDEKEIFNFIKDIEHEGKNYNFHIYGNKNNIDKSEHNLPMYIQILDQQLIKLDQARINLGGEIVYRKHDTVILRNVKEDYEKHLGTDIGEVREQEIKTDVEYYQKIYKDSCLEWKKLLFDGDWHICNNINHSTGCAEKLMMLYNQNQGCLIQGEAGCGKSYVINELKKNFKEEEYLLLAPTNVASLNIGGQTFHKAFGIDSECKISKKIFQAMLKLKAIIIDEGGMVGGELWHIVEKIKDHNPELRIFIFLDWEQNLPVDLENPNYCWKNHPLLKKLVNSNVAMLEYDPKIGRYDNELRNFVFKYRDPQKFNKEGKNALRAKGQTNKNVDVNICFTNKTRKAVNRSRMEYWKIKAENEGIIQTNFFIDPKNYLESHNQTDVVEYNNNEKADMKIDEMTTPENEEQDFRQPTNFVVGMPCIAMATKSKFGFVNGERFIITGLKQPNEMEDERLILRREGFLIQMKSVLDESKIIELHVFDWFKYIAVGYCMTCHKAQGQTINEPFKIWDTEYEHVNKRWLYTALTRASKLEYINV